MQCTKCGKEEVLPFRCAYCGDYFCASHRLPESHDCRQLHLARNVSVIEREGREPSKGVSRPATLLALKSEVFLSRMASMEKGSEKLHLLAGSAIVGGVVLSITYPYGVGLLLLAIVVLSLVASFLAHELAHKLMAMKLGYWASFRLNLFGALISVISIVLPFKFVAPGAVMIFGSLDRRDVARIAAIGPLVNLAIAMTTLFILLTIYTTLRALEPGPALALHLVGEINALMGLINLIPIGPLDGLKVISVSVKKWAVYTAAAVILYAVFMLRLPFAL